MRTDTDDRENRRRIAEEMKKEERLQALRDEAIRSTEQNEYVEKRWDDLSDIHMPQDLQGAIDAQKRACAQILASKDSLIRQFQLELKAKDEEYVKMLKRQAEDVSVLLERMGGQFSKMNDAYEEEMQRVDGVYTRIYKPP